MPQPRWLGHLCITRLQQLQAAVFTRLALALQFLTIAPIRHQREVLPRDVGQSMAFFPLVGAAVGAVLAGADVAFGLVFPDPLRSTLTVVLGVLLTRGLHLDGLMDSCDGLFGGWTPERRLEIMRDSRVGSFGVLAAGLDLLLRVGALVAMPAGARLLVLIAAPTVARWALVVATWAYPYARPAGLGAAYKEHVGLGVLGAATVITIFVATAMLGPFGLPALAGAVALTALVGAFVLARIPGQTGDTYGATNEVVEVGLLIAACARLAL
jgi:adenosylcobinamide-GDP ribazoletransferase